MPQSYAFPVEEAFPRFHEHGTDCCQEAYGALASMSAAQSLTLFRLRPKCHMHGHVVPRGCNYSQVFVRYVRCICLLLRLTMSHQLQSAGYSLNPCVWMTWGDEDFIGKVARTSRRQHARTAPVRTIQTCLITYLRQWRDHFDFR